MTTNMSEKQAVESFLKTEFEKNRGFYRQRENQEKLSFFGLFSRNSEIQKLESAKLGIELSLKFINWLCRGQVHDKHCHRETTLGLPLSSFWRCYRHLCGRQALRGSFINPQRNPQMCFFAGFLFV